MGQTSACQPQSLCFGRDCCAGRTNDGKHVVRTVTANHWSSNGQVQHAPRDGFLIQLDQIKRDQGSAESVEDLAEQSLSDWHGHVQHAPRKRAVIQLDAHELSDGNADCMEDGATRTLSEWYAEEPDGEFVEVAPANMKIANKEEDYGNFKKFKSLSNWLQDGQPRPNGESETTECYFVHDPSQPDS